MLQTKTNKNFFALFTVFLIFLQAFNYVLTADDIFFLNKLSQPITQLLGETFINGRYLGNLFGVIFSVVGNSAFWWIRNIVMGGGIVLLIYLIKKTTLLTGKEAFIVASFVLLTAPPRIYNEVYSWTAGYMNYLFPFLGVLVLIYFFRDVFVDGTVNNNSPLTAVVIFPLSICTQLFMENISLYVAFSMSVLNIYLFVKNKKVFLPALSGFVGSVLGIVLMFLHPGYHLGSEDTYRSVDVRNLNFLFNNTAAVFSYAVTLSTAVCILISILFIFIIKRTDKFNKIKTLFYTIYTAMPLYSILRTAANQYFLFRTISKTNQFIINCCDILSTIVWLVAILITIIKIIDNPTIKRRLLFYLSSCVVLSGPMVLITPNGHRCHFGVLVFWALITCDVIEYIKTKYDCNLNKAYFSMKIITTVVLISLTTVYTLVNIEYIQRRERIENQIAAGATTIVEKSLPFPTYLHLDGGWFYENYYYNEEPCDIRIVFVRE